MSLPEKPLTAGERLAQARQLYRRLISPSLEASNLDRLVAIDERSEDFEIGDDLVDLSRRLRSRHPDARVVGFRVGGGGGPVDRIVSVRTAGTT
jgi:hypothetical protein